MTALTVIVLPILFVGALFVANRDETRLRP